jgi:hypothetical protein
MNHPVFQEVSIPTFPTGEGAASAFPPNKSNCSSFYLDFMSLLHLELHHEAL